MKEESKKSAVYSKPLLYIHQPGAKDVELSMQQTYRVTKEQQSDQVETQAEIQAKIEHEQVKEHIQVDEQLLVEEHKQETIQKKPFKDMEVSEKVDYLLNRPAYIPKPLCSIEVNENAITGYITKREGNDLFIQMQGKVDSIVVSMEEIIAIRMIVW